VLIGAVIAAFVVMRQRRARQEAEQAWQDSIGRSIAEGRAVVDQLRATGSGDAAAEPTLQRKLQELDVTLTSLAATAPATEARNAIGDARGVIGNLSAALESDLRLRMMSTPPTAEQLSTSGELIRERARELDTALDRLALAGTSTSTSA
jgi:hypothetical protein